MPHCECTCQNSQSGLQARTVTCWLLEGEPRSLTGTDCQGKKKEKGDRDENSREKRTARGTLPVLLTRRGGGERGDTAFRGSIAYVGFCDRFPNANQSSGPTIGASSIMITQSSFVFVGFSDARQSSKPNKNKPKNKPIRTTAKQNTKTLNRADAPAANMGELSANHPGPTTKPKVTTKSRTGDRQIYAQNFFMFEQRLKRVSSTNTRSRAVCHSNRSSTRCGHGACNKGSKVNPCLMKAAQLQT